MHDLRIHVDAEILQLDNAGIPLLDSLLDPIREDILNCSMDYIAKPLFGKFIPLLFFWKIWHALRVQSNEFPDLFDAEGLVLRDRQVLDVISWNPFPGTTDEIL